MDSSKVNKPPKDSTKVVHSGKEDVSIHRTVNTPVYRASTILFKDTDEVEKAFQDAYGRSSDSPGVFKKVPFYGRKGNPTTWTLERALTELEKGYDTVLTSSGLGAVTSALFAFLKNGDHLLMSDSVYEPTRHFCDQIMRKYGIETTYYDPLVGEKIFDLFKPSTRVVFMESPGSHTFEIQDVPGICKAVKSKKNQEIVTMIDNTWASPFYYKPLTQGVDISIGSCTKYVVGHSDVMLGSITSVEKHFANLWHSRQLLGVSASPDDVYLATRGLRTLGVRMQKHQENALLIAEWLSSRREVEKVFYPPLKDDPGNEIWQRDFLGAGGLMSFALKDADENAVNRMINGMKYFSLGFSWGGYESLICASYPGRSRTATKWKFNEPGIRLHVGLEDSEDLINDLEGGFERLLQV